MVLIKDARTGHIINGLITYLDSLSSVYEISGSSEFINIIGNPATISITKPDGGDISVVSYADLHLTSSFTIREEETVETLCKTAFKLILQNQS